MEKISRRGLVTALAGAGLVLGSSSRAFAFSEQKDTARLEALRDNACGASSSHSKLVSEVERVLGDKYSPEEKRAVVANLSCPVCGCPLAGLF